MVVQGDAPPEVVGIVGIGAMGGAMARRILEAGHRLLVNDVRRDAGTELEAAGAKWAPTPAQLARGCRFVGIVVADETQLDDVITGPQGVLEGAQPGTLVAVHSTVSPEAVRHLAALAAQRAVILFDAPMSGGVAGARAGTLTVLAGGDADVVTRARPVLKAFADEIVPVGPVGAGQFAKIVSNMVTMVSWVATSEALRLAASGGMGDEVGLSVLNATSGRTWVSERWPETLEGFRASPGGMARTRELMRKDLLLALGLAGAADCEVPLAALAVEEVDGVG